MTERIEQIDFKEGSLLLIDKPKGILSFGLVYQLKKWTQSKVGHAGTLDPLASGLMICCTGKWTKKLAELTGKDKEYEGIIRVGQVTATYDLESLPEKDKDISHITENDLETCRKKFSGKILQVPPVHSAIKVEGKSAYELARKGKDIQLEPRERDVYSFDFLKLNLPEIHFRIRCSSGTYIRSLANDFGQALGCGAFLQELRRTQIDDFRIEEAYTLEELKQHFGTEARLKTIEPRMNYADRT